MLNLIKNVTKDFTKFDKTIIKVELTVLTIIAVLAGIAKIALPASMLDLASLILLIPFGLLCTWIVYYDQIHN